MTDLTFGAVGATGGATVTLATLQPVYDWAFAGFPHDHVPGNLSLLASALTLTAAHALVVIVQRKWFPAKPGAA